MNREAVAVRTTGDLWVFIEQRQGVAHQVSWELIGKASELSTDRGGSVTAVIIGHEICHLASEAFAYGADKALVISDPVFKDYRTTPYCQALERLVGKHRPEIFLLGATALGRDLAGALATTIETGLTADCTALDIDPETKLLRQTRPAFGGNVMATIVCREARPQMATVRPRVFALPSRRPNRAGEIVEETFDAAKADRFTEVLDFIVHDQQATVELETAEIIVAGGRGLGGRENLQLLKELAGLLHAEVAVSRPLVDKGWMPYAHQVGQTGKTVRPKLYLAFGISGAVQHVAGMRDSDVIVAVNNDPDAPIFKVATYGLVADVSEVMPLMAEKIKNARGEPRDRDSGEKY